MQRRTEKSAFECTARFPKSFATELFPFILLAPIQHFLRDIRPPQLRPSRQYHHAFNRIL